MKKISLTFAVYITAFCAYSQNTAWPSTTATANVGIGTTSPGVYKLALSSSDFRILSLNSTYGQINADFANNGVYFGSIGSGRSQTSTGAVDDFGMGTAGTAGNLIFATGTGAYERMRILANGNIGIGTTIPKGILGLGDQAKVVETSGITLGNAHSSVEFLGSVFGAGYGHKIYSQDPGNGAVDLRVAVRQGTTSWTDAMTIRSNTGNVGIGTTNPDQKLTVKGTIHSQEVIVDMSVLPDYVFKPTYHLPTLTEVKAYIAQNHHLPEMPSAEQAAKDGLSLGDMNAKLLKKVEELTLYLIEKDKQVTDQKAINQSLQQAIDELNKQVSTLIKPKP